MRNEILTPLDLDPEESLKLDYHSFLNVFNVIEEQLRMLQEATGLPELKPYNKFCLDILLDVSSADISAKAKDWGGRFSTLLDLLKQLLATHPEQKDRIIGLLEALEVAAVRLGEFRSDRFSWNWVPCDQFEKSLRQFLTATEKISHGRFHFVFSHGVPPNDAYRIEFEISTPHEAVFAPLVLQDTIRDLVGNARKYSDPGTTIAIQLAQEEQNQIHLKITDEGMGIPENEISQVVKFGYRASNALDRRTMGGGFGLTKAYHLCKRFGGQFFIESSPGRGTAVELYLQAPL